MKQEYITAFLAKNNKNFRVSDYPKIKQKLEQLDDNQFPILMQRSFKSSGWKTLIAFCFIFSILAIIFF